jgi:hypothetical protein
MSAFEFFTVLLSFVVSLGVASMLLAVTGLIQESSRVRFSLSYALWAATIFDLQITFWLKSWTYHEAYALRIETSVPPLLLAIIAFIACGLATPRIPETGEIDLRAFHTRQGRKYQVAYAIFMVVAIAQAWLMRNMADDSSNLVMDSIILAVLAVIAVAAAILHRLRWVQILAPAILLVSAVAFYGRLMEQ